MSVYVGFDIGGTKCAVSTGREQDGEIKILTREGSAHARHPGGSHGADVQYGAAPGGGRSDPGRRPQRGQPDGRRAGGVF